MQKMKTHLSSLVDQVEQGEVVVVCRHNKPVAELRAMAPPPDRKPRVPGLLKGQISFAPGAFAPLTDAELAEFDGPLFPAALR